MTSLHTLITALIRLLGLFYCVKALDSAAMHLYLIIAQKSALMAADPLDKTLADVVASPIPIFFSILIFYLVLFAGIFFAAPRLARLIIGKESNQEFDVLRHEFLVLCTGMMILAWGFVRLTDVIYGIMFSSQRGGNPVGVGNPTTVYVFLTAILIFGGFMIMNKSDKISSKVVKKRMTEADDHTSERS